MDCELDQVVTPKRDADYGGDGDGQQHAALNLHHGEHNGQYEADQEDPQHLVVEVGQTRVAATAPPLAAAFGSPGVKFISPTFSMPT